MNTLLKTLTLTAAIGALTSCGNADVAPMDTNSDEANMAQTDHSQMDHADMDHSKMTGDTGHTTGRVISISPNGQAMTVDHKEIEGVGMGAMTMEFTVMSSIDLSSFAADQNVSFMVKKGRDGSYRITAMCNTDADGADCLKAMMDHSGH
jgi:Cu(I)/Ag(I) efflux system protein CusF